MEKQRPQIDSFGKKKTVMFFSVIQVKITFCNILKKMMFRCHWADWKKIHWVLRVKSTLTLLFNYSQWIKSSKSWGSENKLSFTLKSWILLNQAEILNFTPFVSQQTRRVKAPSHRRLFSDMKLVFVCLNLFCLLRITGAIKAQTWILRPNYFLMNLSVH